MTQDDLALTLDSLHKSLVDTPEIDAANAIKLRLLIEEIEFVLANRVPSPASETSHENVTEKIRSLIADFEVHHPKLTANLSLIAERLADMGI